MSDEVIIITSGLRDAFWKAGVLVQLLWLSVGIMLLVYVSPEGCAPC